MAAQKGKMLVVVDLENFIGSIQNDPTLRQCPSYIAVRATTSAIRQMASQHYPDCSIEWLITAFSLPDPQNDAYQREINQITLATLEANRLGYQVLSVKRDENTADHAITELGSALLFDRRIKICMLATQDSGTPFVSFINTVSQRTQMHLVGYDYIPHSFPAQCTIPSSCARGDIIEITQQLRPPMRSSNPGPRPADTVQQSTQKFLRNPDSLTNSEHRAWIAQAIARIQDITQEIREGTFLELARGVRSRWQGPSPPDKQFGDMLNVLATRFFSRRHILVYQPGTMVLFLERFPNSTSSG